MGSFELTERRVNIAMTFQEKLRRFSTLPRFNDEFEEAYEYYFGEPIELSDGTVGTAEFGRFSDWFVFDYRLTSGVRLTDVYEWDFVESLGSSTRRMLRSWTQSYVTVMELQADHGHYYRFYDMLKGKSYEIARRSFPGQLQPWSVVVGRCLPVSRIQVVASGFTIVPPCAKEWLLPRIKGDYRRWKMRASKKDPRSFLQQNGHLFHGHLSALQPWLRSVKDEIDQAQNVLQSRSIYKVHDADSVLEALVRADFMEQLGPGHFVWTDYHGKLIGRTLRSHMKLSKDRLSIECWSFAELQKVKEWLIEVAGNDLTHSLDVFQERSFWFAANHTENVMKSKVTPLKKVRMFEVMKQFAFEQPLSSFAQAERFPYRLNGIPGPWDGAEQLEVVKQMRDHIVISDIPDMTVSETLLVEAATSLWWQFCFVESPKMDNLQAWAAAVICCVAHVFQWEFSRDQCLEHLGGSRDIVDVRVQLIQERLELTPFDWRFSAVAPLEEAQPLTDLNMLSESDCEALVFRDLQMVSQVRTELFDSISPSYSLLERAKEIFSMHMVGVSNHQKMHEAFIDWYYFSWKIPVLGGRTHAEKAVSDEMLPENLRGVLSEWLSTYASFYTVVRGKQVIDHRRLGEMQNCRGNGDELIDLRDVFDGSTRRVHRSHLPGVVDGDVVFTRLVPVQGRYTTMGTSIKCSRLMIEEMKEAVMEEVDLIQRWNNEVLPWSDFCRTYSERLYAIAFRYQAREARWYSG